jgi:hypothetical protein
MDRMRSPDHDHPSRGDRYRIGIAFRADRVLVTIDGAEGPGVDRHLREVERAAEACGLQVVVTRARGDSDGDGGSSAPRPLRARRRHRPA